MEPGSDGKRVEDGNDCGSGSCGETRPRTEESSDGDCTLRIWPRGRTSGGGIVLLMEPIERVAGRGRRERLRS
jgi:hypothetical protein